MKKIALFIILFLFININSFASAKDNSDDSYALLNKVSNDPKILEALKLMKDSPANESYNIILGKNPTNKIIKISFKDLSTLRKQYANLDALGWLRYGRLYIYINSEHKNAPPEALCALIASRTYNQDDTDSINEEIYIWTVEAVEWNYFLEKNPSLANLNTPLVNRENEINEHYKTSKKNVISLEKLVKSLKFYKNFKQQSPGFDDSELRLKLNKLLNE